MPYTNFGWKTDSSDFRIQEISELVHNLTTNLGAEGYAFEKSEQIRPGGFVRVNIGKNLPPGQFDTYLDLRMGPPSPRGNVVEMASSSPQTYGVPGFTRHIMGQSRATNVLSTFSDYVRSIYSRATETGKTAQEVAWPVYQEGYEGFQYPGSGMVVTPAALSGRREMAAATIRYYVPQGTRVDDYVKGVVAQQRSKSPIPEVHGYNIESSKWKAWVPGASMGLGTEVGLGRPLEKWQSSMRIALEATEAAQEAYYMGPGGRVQQIQPSQPTTGYGVRGGWTQSSIIYPGERTPRIGRSVQLAIGDQPDLPGAGYVSPSMKRITQESGQTYELYSYGEAANQQFRFGINTVDQLAQMMNEGKMTIQNIEGRVVEPGQGKYEIGHWLKTDMLDSAKDQREFIRLDQRGYKIGLHKPTLNIPRYYDPTIEGGRFSNMPVHHKGQLMTTDALVEQAKEYFGNQINISNISSVQTEEGAEAYINTPISRFTPFAQKTGGGKYFGYQVPQEMEMRFLGVSTPQEIDTFTGEVKIDPRKMMGAFGNMNMKTQLDFLSDALKNEKGVAELKKYVSRQYDDKGLTAPIDVDEMAKIYGKEVNKPMSGDMLFEGMISNLLGMYDETAVGKKAGRRLWRKYRIGLPEEQDFGAVVYSKSQMDERMRLIKELPPEAQKLFTFEKFSRGQGDDIDALAQAMFGDDAPQQYLHKFRVPGKGQNITMQTMETNVSEYPFQRGFVNAKAIMSFMQRFPQHAMEMGLTGSVGSEARWLGATEPRIGEIAPHIKGWNEMAGWFGFQTDFRMRSEDMSVPRGAVPLTPILSGMIGDVMDSALLEKTTERQLRAFRKGIDEIDLSVAGLPEEARGARLSESFLWDEKSMTLAPRVSSIEGIESYDEGIKQGQTVTRFGQSYFSLVREMLQSADTNIGARAAQMRAEQNKFYGRVNEAFFPKGARSKAIFRHLIGANLPGMRGGRYQGFPQGPTGHAFAKDSWIKRMLAYNKYATHDDPHEVAN
jgi:hypothetical protein